MLFTMAELCEKAEKERDHLAYALVKIADSLEKAEDSSVLALSADEKNARVVLSLIEVIDNLTNSELSSWSARANALRAYVQEAK